MLHIYSNKRLIVSAPRAVAHNPEVFANWLDALVESGHRVGSLQRQVGGSVKHFNTDLEAAIFWADAPWIESKEDIARAKELASQNL